LDYRKVEIKRRLKTLTCASRVLMGMGTGMGGVSASYMEHMHVI